MSAIKQWAFSLCAAMVAAGLVRMLLPKSSMEKLLRMVISVFFLSCLLSPAVLRDPALMVETEAAGREEMSARSERVTELAEKQLMDSARSALERLVREKLSQRGINAHEVTINIIAEEENDPRLESVELVLDSDDQEGHGDLCQELGRELGAPVTIRTL